MKRLAAGAVALMLLDPGRLLLTGLLLRRLKHTNPEMFDGALAAEAVRYIILTEA